MKLINPILLIVFICFASPLFSQQATGTVKGKLIDSTADQSLKGATISILSNKDTALIAYALAKEDGSFIIEKIPFGEYFLLISFLSFSDTVKSFSLTAANPVFNTGNIFIYQLKVLGEVIVRAPLIVINGDTTEFNATQIKTIPNATAEDLLKKLPGVEVEKDGTVKAQGETVTRVLVDGKKFFSNDPKMATKNIPAEIIEKIQLIDAMSEQSEFSGFDDGNRVKTINIVTKKDRRKGVFGKASAAAGNKERYATAVSANRFNGNQQISFIGQGNNVNNQGFTIQDFLGSMGNNSGGSGRGGGGGGANVFSGNPNGLSRTMAGGVNYNDTWSKKTLVNASYFYNNIRATNDRDRFRETIFSNDSSRFLTEQFYSLNNNKNHRFNFEIDHRFDSLNSILIRPNFSYQETDASSETHSLTMEGKSIPLTEVNAMNTSHNTGYNFSNMILYRRQFNKRGRTFSINFTQSMNTNDRSSTNLSYRNTFGKGIDTVDKISRTERDGKGYGVNISFTERITSRSQMEFNYNYNHNENQSDQQTFQSDSVTGLHSIVVPNQTNFFENTNISHRSGINYRVQINSEWNYAAGMAVQYAQLSSDNLTKKTFLEQSFYNLFPTFYIQYRKPRSKNFRFSYRGSTQQPSITQLQDVIDDNNVLHIRSGNPALKQEFNNNFNLNYNTVNIKTFKNFSVTFNASFVSNKISNTNTTNLSSTDSMIIDGYKIGPNVEFSKPRNLNGAFSVGSFVNYSVPVKNPKSRINLTTRFNYSRDVNLINLVKTYTNNYVFGGSVRFTMNLKEKLDVNFSSNSTYNIVRYSFEKALNGDYFTQRFSIEPTWSTKSGWILSNDFDYVMNRGQSSGFNQSVPLWNAGIAKLFLKKKEGELRFSVFDILNQNKNITRNVEQNYIEDVRTEVLNRYFLLSFTYYLRKFKGQQQGRMNDNRRRNNFERGNNNFNNRRRN